MKKLLVSVLLGLIGLGLSAQESESAKTGWSFVPFPDVSYNSDLGLNLGAFSDFFYYGDGSVYPNFLHHIAVAGAWATKGSWYLHGMFDSPSLIPGARVTGSLTWRDCSANNFYGFNGIASPFDATMDMNQETRTAYYTYHRQLLRASALFQTARVAKPNALAGLVFRHIGISDFSLEKYDSDRTLYRAYQAAGLIRSDEAAGGSSLELKLGGSWDTRDVELVPNKGFYAEAYLNGNLDLSHGKYHYAQLVLHWRHFVPIVFKRLTFAYHLGLQQKFVGNMPFYMLPEIATLYYQYEENEGMGSRYTAREIPPGQEASRNRYSPPENPTGTAVKSASCRHLSWAFFRGSA